MRLSKRNLHLPDKIALCPVLLVIEGCSPRDKNLMVDQFILGAEENILIKGYIEISYVELETN